MSKTKLEDEIKIDKIIAHQNTTTPENQRYLPSSSKRSPIYKDRIQPVCHQEEKAKFENSNVSLLRGYFIFNNRMRKSQF